MDNISYFNNTSVGSATGTGGAGGIERALARESPPLSTINAIINVNAIKSRADINMNPVIVDTIINAACVAVIAAGKAVEIGA